MNVVALHHVGQFVFGHVQAQLFKVVAVGVPENHFLPHLLPYLLRLFIGRVHALHGVVGLDFLHFRLKILGRDFGSGNPAHFGFIVEKH